MHIIFNLIVVLVAVVVAVALKEENGCSMPLPLFQNSRSASSPIFYAESPKEAFHFIGTNKREGRFWAPWSSVSAFSRGRFHTGNENKSKSTGIQGYNNVVTELSTIMANTRPSRLWNKPKDKELVAFNVNSGTTSGNGNALWLRGIICNSAFYSSETGKKKFSAPTAEVFLFDSGHKLTTNTGHIYQLPDKFKRIPPFAVRCSLYGIQPANKPNENETRGPSQATQSGDKSDIGWSRKAIVDFQKLVKSPEDLMDTGKLQAKILVVVEVKKCPSPGETNQVLRANTNDAYSVMITVPSCESGGRGINVSEEMVKLGHGDYTHPHHGFSFKECELFKPFSSLR